MSTSPSVDRRFFENNMTAIASLGVDIDALCRRRGITYPLSLPGDRIPLALASPVFDAVGEELSDPEYVYRLAPVFSPAGIGTMFQLLMCCESLLDALRLVCRYSAIASDVVSYRFQERGKLVDVEVTPCPNAYVSFHQLEGAVFMGTQYRRFVAAGSGGLLVEAFFAHGPRFPVARYEDYFGCPVRFHATRNGLRLNRDVLDTPMPGADQRLRDYYRAMAERYEGSIGAGDSPAQRVQRLFLQRMSFGEPDRADIARALNTSVRTLQRQLRAQGVSYRDVVESAREAAARRELADPTRPVHEIAFLLGYADVRSFRRAFQRWTGLSPGDFRRREKKGSESISAGGN